MGSYVRTQDNRYPYGTLDCGNFTTVEVMIAMRPFEVDQMIKSNGGTRKIVCDVRCIVSCPARMRCEYLLLADPMAEGDREEKRHLFIPGHTDL